MSVIQVTGGNSLYGEITVQGSKNAVLPLMAASVLHKGITVIDNVPKIQDVYCMMGILSSLGCKVVLEDRSVCIDASGLSKNEISRQDMEKMRSSIILVGPLLTRTGRAAAYYPGGCSIGKRPINLHFAAWRALGAEVMEKDGRIMAQAKKLCGSQIVFPYPSVGATENALMTAVGAEGVTRLIGCAREPEIVELCCFLRTMGANIRGEGTSFIEIEGGKELHGVRYRVSGDRIAAGTYLAAAMSTRGEVGLHGVLYENLRPVLDILAALGAEIHKDEDGIRLRMAARPRGGCFVHTAPYPGFPTDMQPLLLSVFAQAEGENRIEETVFEGRFEAARELQKFGAEFIIREREVLVKGTYPLCKAKVHAPDLRGGAALVVAALAAEGCSEISGYEYIARGYESICEVLSGIGAKIRLVP